MDPSSFVSSESLFACLGVRAWLAVSLDPTGSDLPVAAEDSCLLLVSTVMISGGNATEPEGAPPLGGTLLSSVEHWWSSIVGIINV